MPSTYPSAPSPSSWTLRTQCWVIGTLVLWLSLMLSSGTPLTSFSFSRGEWSANNGGSKLAQWPQAARTDEGEKKLQGASGASWPQQVSLDLLFCVGTTWATAERMKSGWAVSSGSSWSSRWTSKFNKSRMGQMPKEWHWSQVSEKLVQINSHLPGS